MREKGNLEQWPLHPLTAFTGAFTAMVLRYWFLLCKQPLSCTKHCCYPSYVSDYLSAPAFSRPEVLLLQQNSRAGSQASKFYHISQATRRDQVIPLPLTWHRLHAFRSLQSVQLLKLSAQRKLC